MEFRDLKAQYSELKEDIDKGISSVIENAQFISGPQVKVLEERLAAFVGVKHCITCANGTDAISLALMAMNIGVGDAVFVPDFTFFSSGECPAFSGATPVFVDVCESTYNISSSALEESIIKVISDAKYSPKAVVAVDLFGQPAEYDKIKAICNKYSLFLIEDSAQGFGGMINLNGGEVKAGAFGDISTTSFFPAKPLGCYGDGGAVFTDNDEWAELIRSYAVHGKSGNDKYNNIRIGMNSRLDTLQAAILLPKLDAFVKYELDKINQVASWYYEGLKGCTLGLPEILPFYRSSWAQFTIRLPHSVNRAELQAKMKEKGIPTMVYYMNPMHSQLAFRGTYSENAVCPITEKLCKTVLSLPMHPYMSREDVEKVASCLKQLLED